MKFSYCRCSTYLLMNCGSLESNKLLSSVIFLLTFWTPRINVGPRGGEYLCWGPVNDTKTLLACLFKSQAEIQSKKDWKGKSAGHILTNGGFRGHSEGLEICAHCFQPYFWIHILETLSTFHIEPRSHLRLGQLPCLALSCSGKAIIHTMAIVHAPRRSLLPGGMTVLFPFWNPSFLGITFAGSAQMNLKPAKALNAPRCLLIPDMNAFKTVWILIVYLKGTVGDVCVEKNPPTNEPNDYCFSAVPDPLVRTVSGTTGSRQGCASASEEQVFSGHLLWNLSYPLASP